MTTETTHNGSRARRWAQGGLTAALVVIIGLNIWYFGFRDTRTHALEGEVAPTFSYPVITGQGLNGKTVSPEDHRGKVVLLDFWATHCAPCKRQMPILEELQAEVGDDKLQVVSINMDFEPTTSRAPKVSKFLEDGGFTFPVILGDRGVLELYAFTRIPFMVVIDPTGKVDSVHTGLRSKKRLHDEIAGILP